MAYLPKNKYKKLYTKGGQYRLVTTGEPYVGDYIKLNNGQLFAGSDPSDIKGRLEKLYPVANNNVVNKYRNNQIYTILKEKLVTEQDQYISILGGKPTPTIIDYSNGHFNRYLSVRLNTEEYKEISLDVYENFYKRKYNRKLNKVFFVKWYLGEDSEIKNSKILRDLEYNLPGIFDFFPNKSEYGMKNGIIQLNNSKIYPNGEAVPKNLPASYQVGNKNINEIKNTNVPSNQHCAKCIFAEKGNCTRWNAKVRNDYYCRAFKGKGTQPPDSVGY